VFSWQFKRRVSLAWQGGFLAGCCLVVDLNAATDYYVSTTGSDAAAGTFAAPWRTVQRAANGNGIGAGDTCYIRGGSYVELVTVSNRHGQAALPMTFTSYPGETAIIEWPATPPAGTSALLTIANSDHIIVKGIEFRNHKTSTASKDLFGIYIYGACNGVQIRNNKVHDIWQSNAVLGNFNANAHGIAALGTAATAINGLVIDGNELYNLRLGASEALALNGNVTNFAVTNNLIHDCNNIGIDFIGYEGTSGTASLDRARDGVCSGNTVYNIDSRYNPAYNGDFTTGGGDPAADGIYVDGGTNIIVERNHVYACNIGIELASEAGSGKTDLVTLRNNIVHHNHTGGLSMGGYDELRGRTENCTVANNSFYQNDTLNSGSGQITLQFYLSGNTFKNNIVWARGDSKQMIVNDYTGNHNATVAQKEFGSGNTFLYNRYYCSPGSSTNLEFDLFNGGAQQSYSTLAQWQGTTGETVSAFGNPGFVTATPGATPTVGDFALSSTSSCINAGQPSPGYVSGTNEKDYFGQSRVASSRVDIGADEYLSAAQAWRDFYFALPDGGTDANATDDPDNDGIKNLIEYALSGNPTLPSQSILPIIGQSGGHPTLTFNRNVNATDVTFIVQASTNLSTWTTIASKIGTAAWTTTSGVIVNDPGRGPVTVVDSATFNTGARFLRLSVTQ
jgi:hypothetical protein